MRDVAAGTWTPWRPPDRTCPAPPASRFCDRGPGRSLRPRPRVTSPASAAQNSPALCRMGSRSTHRLTLRLRRGRARLSLHARFCADSFTRLGGKVWGAAAETKTSGGGLRVRFAAEQPPSRWLTIAATFETLAHHRRCVRSAPRQECVHSVAAALEGRQQADRRGSPDRPQRRHAAVKRTWSDEPIISNSRNHRET
jgi:hypothetical protein